MKQVKRTRYQKFETFVANPKFALVATGLATAAVWLGLYYLHISQGS